MKVNYGRFIIITACVIVSLIQPPTLSFAARQEAESASVIVHVAPELGTKVEQITFLKSPRLKVEVV